MIIHVPIGTTHTVTLRGRTFREVTCEHCGAGYLYLLTVHASAKAFNALHLDSEGAVGRAVRRADADLKQAMQLYGSPVACPKCGNYQKHMLRMLRRRRVVRYGWIVAAPLIWLALEWCFRSPEDRRSLHAAGLIGASALLAMMCALIEHKWNDNHDAATRAAKDPTSGGRAMLRADYEELIPKASPPATE